jgi:hypothetical protein
VQCNKPGGMQLRLLPFAIATFMAYTVGFPLVLAIVLIRNRKLIVEDQVLCEAASACPVCKWVGRAFPLYRLLLLLMDCSCLCCTVAVVLRCNPQILRAYGLGELRLDNPNAYMVRKCLAKMYFHFKPEFWYWKIGIMVRKFLIVFAGTALPLVAELRVFRNVQGDKNVAHGEPVQSKQALEMPA